MQLKKGNSNTKTLAYMSLVRPIVEYGAACWDPYREGQIGGIDRAQNRAAKLTYHANRPNWETLASRRNLSRICAIQKRTLENGRGRLQETEYNGHTS